MSEIQPARTKVADELERRTKAVVNDPSPAFPRVSSGIARIPEIMRRMRLWMLFFGILSLVGAGLFFFVGLTGLFTALRGLRVRETIFMVLRLCLFGLAGLLALSFFRYAKRITKHLAEPGDDFLVEVLDAQHLCWKRPGFLVIARFGLAFLSLLVGVFF